MFSYLSEQYLSPAGLPPPPPPLETPPTGCLHPDAPGRFFAGPAEYMRWYEANGKLRGTGAPVVGVLLYRKHVITDQPYVPQLISQLEDEGLIPVGGLGVWCMRGSGWSPGVLCNWGGVLAAFWQHRAPWPPPRPRTCGCCAAAGVLWGLRLSVVDARLVGSRLSSAALSLSVGRSAFPPVSGVVAVAAGQDQPVNCVQAWGLEGCRPAAYQPAGGLGLVSVHCLGGKVQRRALPPIKRVQLPAPSCKVGVQVFWMAVG
jgi:hypothetical protein